MLLHNNKKKFLFMRILLLKQLIYLNTFFFLNIYFYIKQLKLKGKKNVSFYYLDNKISTS